MATMAPLGDANQCPSFLGTHWDPRAPAQGRCAAPSRSWAFCCGYASGAKVELFPASWSCHPAAPYPADPRSRIQLQAKSLESALVLPLAASKDPQTLATSTCLPPILPPGLWSCLSVPWGSLGRSWPQELVEQGMGTGQREGLGVVSWETGRRQPQDLGELLPVWASVFPSVT